jgi:hypothetical protein
MALEEPVKAMKTIAQSARSGFGKHVHKRFDYLSH